MRYATFTLRIEGPEEGLGNTIVEIGGALSQAEDAVNDALPDGFYCKIDEVDMDVVRKIAKSKDVPC